MRDMLPEEQGMEDPGEGESLVENHLPKRLGERAMQKILGLEMPAQAQR